MTIRIPHIYADTSKPIGNVLDIKVRQASNLNFKVFYTDLEAVLKIDPSDLVAGTHDLVIESFDDNSIKKSTLKTDTIQIIVP